MPSSIVVCDGNKYLYYTGWNVRKTVPYHNSIGLAISEDNGQTFCRVFEGPILERNSIEPYFCAVPFVMKEERLWRMWYLSCVKWEERGGRCEPYYNIAYAESMNGINWERAGIVSVDFKSSTEAGIVRPCVIKEGAVYKMWYSCRGVNNYRTDRTNSYRIGYAESEDGIKWQRKDELAGIDVSESGWDTEMIEYPYVYEHKGSKYMMYNGNGFGKSGIGYAVLS